MSSSKMEKENASTETAVGHRTCAPKLGSEVSEGALEGRKLPRRFREAHLMQGYGRKMDSFYRTTSSDYGSRGPCQLTMPAGYFGMNRKFTHRLAQCGMYRNHSVNI
ncbi:unnamed protein product [Clavelina lepadiformis]|uniref:Uncharacterized protein n=1 Tax=Clavelina lepadiformis TaxID=159417 RepID=A0ABP0GSL0_CLALP